MRRCALAAVDDHLGGGEFDLNESAAGLHRGQPHNLRDRQGARGCANEGNSDAGVGDSEGAACADLALCGRAGR